MENSLLLAVFAGLAGMFGWGFADFFAKKTIDKVGDMTTLTWAHIYGAAFLASLVWARSLAGGGLSGLPQGSKELSIIMFFGVLQALVYFFAYRGFGKGKLALLNPIFSSYSGLAVILSVMVFGEVLGGWQLAVLALIFTGILLINVDHESLALGKLKFLKIPGMKDMLNAALLAGFWIPSWAHFVSGKDWLAYAAVMYVFMTATIILLSLKHLFNPKIFNKSVWKYFFLIGFSEVIAYVGISLGFSQTSHTSVVAVLSAGFSIPTVILARIFLKERVTKLQFFGVALVISGVVLVSLV